MYHQISGAKIVEENPESSTCGSVLLEISSNTEGMFTDGGESIMVQMYFILLFFITCI